jgi:hypothetical protein
MKEQRFEKVVEWKEDKELIDNAQFFWTFIAVTIITLPLTLIVFMLVGFFNYLRFIRNSYKNRKVYYRRIK